MSEALEVNGYNEERWLDAVDLHTAIEMYASKTKDCVFCAYNVAFDWGFISEAFVKTGIVNHMNTEENHDRLDLLTMAWMASLKNSEKRKFNFQRACAVFGVPIEPDPHTALNGAMTAYALYKKINSIK